jgi:hypothetical protein
MTDYERLTLQLLNGLLNGQTALLLTLKDPENVREDTITKHLAAVEVLASLVAAQIRDSRSLDSKSPTDAPSA